MIWIIARFIQRSNTKTTKNCLVQGFGNVKTLLDNKEFVTHLKFFLKHAKGKHCDTKDKSLYWEMIKMEIRYFCIHISKQLAIANEKKEIDLLWSEKHWMSISLKNNQDTNLVVEVECIRLKLHKISEHKTKGVKIRSRAVKVIWAWWKKQQTLYEIRKACLHV